jgi:hypothetical protein
MDHTQIAGNHDTLADFAVACSVVPARTTSATEARELVARDGAAVLTGLGSMAADQAKLHASDVVGPGLLTAPDVFTVVVEDGDARVELSRVLSDRLVTLDLHTDGYSYGDSLPDWLFLGCESSSPFGGASILTDGYAVVDGLRAEGGQWAELVDLLETVRIDQVPAFQPRGLSTVIQRTAGGRRFMRRNSFQRVADDAPDDDATTRQRYLVDLWHATWNLLSRGATPFRLAPGELLCIDNYRMQHGRLPFVGTPRTYQRVWAWSDAALHVPDGVPPVSDWRHVANV